MVTSVTDKVKELNRCNLILKALKNIQNEIHKNTLKFDQHGRENTDEKINSAKLQVAEVEKTINALKTVIKFFEI